MVMTSDHGRPVVGQKLKRITGRGYVRDAIATPTERGEGLHPPPVAEKICTFPAPKEEM
jgi:hypothetical protein